MAYSNEIPAQHAAPPSTRSEGFLSETALSKMEEALDNQFSFAGIKFGLDGLIGLVPVVGDVATAGISGVIIGDAWKRGVRKRTLARMAANTGVDLVVGSVPVLGDLLDFAIRSNVKNIRLMRHDLACQNRAVA